MSNNSELKNYDSDALNYLEGIAKTSLTKSEKDASAFLAENQIYTHMNNRIQNTMVPDEPLFIGETEMEDPLELPDYSPLPARMQVKLNNLDAMLLFADGIVEEAWNK